jgi:DNA-binding NtrC family response regulator
MSICSVLENPQIYPSPTSVEGAGKDGLFLSSSPMMTRIHGYLERFASVNAPVLLLGESGVGKEVFARPGFIGSPHGAPAPP